MSKNMRRQSTLFVKVKTERKLAIPEDKIKEYKEAFDMFDKKQKGTIGSIDIWKIMKNFGYLIDKAEVDSEVAKLDEDGDGEINFEEFISFIQRTYVEVDDSDSIIQAFKTFDKNNTGFIDLKEFKYILSALGMKLNDETVKLIFEESSLKEKGKLNYYDFVKYWKQYDP
jgi:calmodulin